MEKGQTHQNNDMIYEIQDVFYQIGMRRGHSSYSEFTNTVGNDIYWNVSNSTICSIVQKIWKAQT